MNENEQTTLNHILDAAQSEFLEKGFQSASLRNIVKTAGVTTGAFYGYYKSKEQLFDALVGKQYNFLIDLYRRTLKEFEEQSPELQKNNMQNYTADAMKQMTEYIYENYVAFKLILCSSDGTKYEHLIHDLAKMDIDATHDFSLTMKQYGISLETINPQLEHMLISGMFSAYFEIVIHDIPRENVDKYISQLLDFYVAGWKEIMGF